MLGTTVAVTGGLVLVGNRIVQQLRATGARPLVVGRLDAYDSAVYGDRFGVEEGVRRHAERLRMTPAATRSGRAPTRSAAGDQSDVES
ncbi:hypothetical protein ACIHFE_33810 [Streptomyces sp. NPDC052396]|uniref:hypothetical protein n=1 Tax=Streptomyces sp. NPDC052396 TaxID=3365689 RepID=UPI0037D41026